MRISVDQRVEWSLEAITRRVLIIDDDPAALAVAAEALTAAGYTVRTAVTVTDFCRATIGWDPDLVLVDMFMPEMDGDDLCSLIKFTLPDIPVVLFSSADEATLAMVARSCGADGHIHTRPDFAGFATRVHRFDRAYG